MTGTEFLIHTGPISHTLWIETYPLVAIAGISILVSYHLRQADATKLMIVYWHTKSTDTSFFKMNSSDFTWVDGKVSEL